MNEIEKELEKIVYIRPMSLGDAEKLNERAQKLLKQAHTLGIQQGREERDKEVLEYIKTRKEFADVDSKYVDGMHRAFDIVRNFINKQ